MNYERSLPSSPTNHAGSTMHGRRRNRAIVSTILATVAAKGIVVVGGLALTPLLTRQLGAAGYGVWVLIGSAYAWASGLDIGLSSSLMNSLAEAFGKARHEAAQRATATAFWLLLSLTVVVAGVSSMLMHVLDATTLIADHLGQQPRQATTALMIAIGIGWSRIPLTITSTIYRAYQEAPLDHAWAALANVIGIVALWIVLRLGGDMIALVLAMFGTSAFILLLNALWLFGWHRPNLRPTLHGFDRRSAWSLLHTGVAYCCLQLSAMVLFQSDSFIIATRIGVEAVGPYSLVYSLFFGLILVQTSLLAPCWPAYAEAAARSDWPWIAMMCRRSLWISMTAIPALVGCLIGLTNPLLHFWIGGGLQVDPVLIWLVGFWIVIAAWGNTFAFLHMGIGRIRLQVLCNVGVALLNLVLSILWAPRFGVRGVIGATIVSYSCISLWILPLDAWRMIRRNCRRQQIQ